MDDAHRTATLLEIVYPGQTNSQGTLFGGHALSLMDRLAFILASRFTRKPVVTAMSDKIEFLTPVKEGELVDLLGTVIHVGRTSLRLRIERYGEDLLSGDLSLCTTGEFVMVAVDATGRPTPIAG
jgi:acyl-CoA hydrolase